MMIAKISSATLQGLEALPVTIEVSAEACSQPRFMIVGLPDAAVRESQERVLSALTTNGYKIGLKQIVVNMAPADVKKEGSGFDLPIAIGILLSMEVIERDDIGKFMFVGELSLDGSIQPIKGILPIAIKAREMGFEGLFVPEDNVREAAVVNRIKVYGVKHILDVVGCLSGTTQLDPTIINRLSTLISMR